MWKTRHSPYSLSVWEWVCECKVSVCVCLHTTHRTGEETLFLFYLWFKPNLFTHRNHKLNKINKYSKHKSSMLIWVLPIDEIIMTQTFQSLFLIVRPIVSFRVHTENTWENAVASWKQLQKCFLCHSSLRKFWRKPNILNAAGVAIVLMSSGNSIYSLTKAGLVLTAH